MDPYPGHLPEYPGHLPDNSHGPLMIKNLGLPMIEDVLVSILSRLARIGIQITCLRRLLCCLNRQEQTDLPIFAIMTLGSSNKCNNKICTTPALTRTSSNHRRTFRGLLDLKKAGSEKGDLSRMGLLVLRDINHQVALRTRAAQFPPGSYPIEQNSKAHRIHQSPPTPSGEHVIGRIDPGGVSLVIPLRRALLSSRSKSIRFRRPHNRKHALSQRRWQHPLRRLRLHLRSTPGEAVL